MHLRTDPAHFPSPSAKPADSDMEWSADRVEHISSHYHQTRTSCKNGLSYTEVVCKLVYYTVVKKQNEMELHGAEIRMIRSMSGTQSNR